MRRLTQRAGESPERSPGKSPRESPRESPSQTRSQSRSQSGQRMLRQTPGQVSSESYESTLHLLTSFGFPTTSFRQYQEVEKRADSANKSAREYDRLVKTEISQKFPSIWNRSGEKREEIVPEKSGLEIPVYRCFWCESLVTPDRPLSSKCAECPSRIMYKVEDTSSLDNVYLAR